MATSATLMIKIVTVAKETDDPENLYGLSALFNEVRSRYPTYPGANASIDEYVELPEMISCTLALCPALDSSSLKSAIWVTVHDLSAKIRLICDMNMIIYHHGHFTRAKISKSDKRVDFYDDLTTSRSSTMQKLANVFYFDEEHCYLKPISGNHEKCANSKNKIQWMRDYGFVFTIFPGSSN